MPIVSIQEEFNSRLCILNKEEINEINTSVFDVSLNNVVEGFHRYFIGISFGECENVEEYWIIFISNFGIIKGLSLKSGRKVKNRDILTLEFAKYIERENPINPLTVFNSFQQKLKGIYERSGIVCLPFYFMKNDYTLDMLVFNKAGADYLLQIDILNLYRSYFSHAKVEDKKGTQKVYLLYDGKDDMVKIGETKDLLPNRRRTASEATKRAKNPKVDILVAWIAPKIEETNLHKKYHKKRERGEWFDLRAKDIEDISGYMKQYEIIDPREYSSSMKEFLL